MEILHDMLGCWHMVVHGIYRFFAVTWPVFAAYGIVYVAGAAAFLANLRAHKGESGRLEVATDSWAYMLARPYRYGQLKDAEPYEHYSWRRPTSICLIYARLINMLLFVWPVLLVYFAVVCAVGSLVGVLVLGVGYVKPNLSNDGFLEDVAIKLANYDNNAWQFLLTRPLVWELIVTGVAMAVWKWTAFLVVMGLIGKVLLCAIPFITLIGAVVWISRKVVKQHADPATSVGMLSEAVMARKEKFCKMVDIK